MSKTILLVDDDALMRRSLAFHLEQAGYHVHTAANAEDALSLARTSPPGLVMLDIGLPGMDGLDALRELKSQHNLPVIFLTARRRELDEVVGLELGADDYITKPFDVDVVLAHIKAVLRRTERISQPGKPEERGTAASNVNGVHLGILGVTVNETVSKEMELSAGQQGVLVAEVESGSLADTAGLRAGTKAVTINGQQVMVGGDIITAVNDQPVAGIEELKAALAQLSTDKGLTLTILRDGMEVQITINPGK